MAKKRKKKKFNEIKALSRKLAMRDGAYDGRFKVRVIANKKRKTSREACRKRVSEES
jgi:hypothetical protein